MTKKEAFAEINKIQDYYVDELIKLINDSMYESMKIINFTSPTGTGKTKMMSKLINKFPDYFFVITTLSKGQLHIQVRDNLNKDCENNNFIVYGSADYKINSRLDAETIIGKIPRNTRCIWLRDEGHIRTNRFDELLRAVCYKVVNFSATNVHSDIQCNFTQTMMLRTVNQTIGTPKDAINKLLEVKKAHNAVTNYNPCAIFRCVEGKSDLYKEIVELCKSNNLKYIDISENAFVMSELCMDDNEYDVIINKFKLVEGIDIRRAHVLYMDNQPSNNATTIQAIGRCRRNALLYRDDIDILSAPNENLLKKTRECYVYYNVKSMKVDTDENGELQYAFCNHISCEALKPDTVIQVKDGQLPNGLYIIELEGKNGKYLIKKDEDTGFNVVSPTTEFYNKKTENSGKYVYVEKFYGSDKAYYKIRIDNIKKFPVKKTREKYDFDKEKYISYKTDPYYDFIAYRWKNNVQIEIPEDVKRLFAELKEKYTKDYIYTKLSCDSEKKVQIDISGYQDNFFEMYYLQRYVSKYIVENENKKGMSHFCRYISWIIGERYIDITKYKDMPYCYQWINENHFNGFEKLSYYGAQKDFFDRQALLLLKYYCIKWKEDESLSSDESWKMIERLASLIFWDFHFEKNNKNILLLIHLLFDRKLYEANSKLYNSLLKGFDFDLFFIKLKPTGKIIINPSLVNDYFKHLDDLLDDYANILALFDKDSAAINNIINKTIKMLDVSNEFIQKDIIGRIVWDYKSLYEELDDTELFMAKRGLLRTYIDLPTSEFELLKKNKAYKKIVNDRESAIIGVDLMRPIKGNNGDDVYWTESKAVSAKIGNYNKFNIFISQKYNAELEQAKPQYFAGENYFKLDKKCNSMLGYCVEYYSKYLVYGENYLLTYIRKAMDESGKKKLENSILVRACMLKYREMMVQCFGPGVAKVIPSVSVEELVKAKYSYFVNLVVELGSRTANYVKTKLYYNKSAQDEIDPNLSIRHITGLADYITTDTILDVKVRNNIDEKCVRQVLAYHYLSTKRSDLSIKRLIVYDAVSEKDIVINVSSE